MPTPAHRQSPGVGWKAPISKVVGFLRIPPGVGRLPGTEGTGAKGCQVEEGRGEIGIFADVPQPSCVRVAPDEPVSVVNRTGAYHRSEGHPITLRIGPYGTRLRPQQAIRFAPVGRFLGRGYHQVRVGSGRGGVAVICPERFRVRSSALRPTESRTRAERRSTRPAGWPGRSAICVGARR